jgi:hypothetical protein
MKINEYLIKVSQGKAPIAGSLEIGQDVEVAIQGNVVKVEDTDNQDGTINRTYVIKSIVAEVINLEKKNEQSSWQTFNF